MIKLIMTTLCLFLKVRCLEVITLSEYFFLTDLQDRRILTNKNINVFPRLLFITLLYDKANIQSLLMLLWPIFPLNQTGRGYMHKAVCILYNI